VGISREIGQTGMSVGASHTSGLATTESHLRLHDSPPYNLIASPNLAPFLKWPGGKSQELPAIAGAAPSLAGRYVDPFVGGGAVLLAVPHEVKAWANDAVEDLVELYRAAAEERTAFRHDVSGIARAWGALGPLDDLYGRLADDFLEGSSGLSALSASGGRSALRCVVRFAGVDLEDEFFARLSRDLPIKFDRMRGIQKAVDQTLNERDLLANVEGAIRSAFYMSIRARYNAARLSNIRNEVRIADFFFLREFAYAAMFRFNARGEFNVPYGGMTYNRKSFAEKVDVLFGSAMLGRLQNTMWRCTDFETFLDEVEPIETDFVFVDPPYDSDFSSYDNRSFDSRDQERLQHTLEGLPARVMIVIKDTALIRRLYRSDRWRMAETDKTYMWTIKSRNERDVIHLTITNY
jgi:DNA adenine methylase